MPHNINDPETKFLVVALVYLVIIFEFFIRNEPNPQCTSILTGAIYYEELMAESCNENTFKTGVAKMSKGVFTSLLQLLTIRGGLEDSHGICRGEKLMAFMDILSPSSMRKLGHRWQHSTETLHRNINEVIRSILLCKSVLIKPVTDNEPIPYVISDNPKFFPYLENCVGALDGNFIDAFVRAEYTEAFRNRKSQTSQNVLGVIRFDMTWTFVLAGWEGKAHHSRVLGDAYIKGLRKNANQYYLGDASYALSRFVLTPYRGVRYHLREWGAANVRPQCREELFNLRHAQLRNVVERGFGIIKKMFPILKHMSPFPMRKQVNFVIVCFILFNFIRIHSDYEDPEEFFNDDGDDAPNEGQNDAQDYALNHWRDGIAQNMWNDYQQILQDRGLI